MKKTLFFIKITYISYNFLKKNEKMITVDRSVRNLIKLTTDNVKYNKIYIYIYIIAT